MKFATVRMQPVRKAKLEEEVEKNGGRMAAVVKLVSLGIGKSQT